MVTERDHNLCTGCGVCTAICPPKCLELRLNEDGFYQAECREELCIQCGACDRVCPKYMEDAPRDALRVLSAVSHDRDVLRTTSSGGLCYELAVEALAKGKKICACVYNYEKHRAEHTVITDLSGLEATKGSKYMQSYTPDAFSEVFDGGEWVVFGSPCQIAAIDAAAKMKKVREKLLLVDFFCHGTPSMNLWRKYVSEQGGKRIRRIDFRSKEFGWHTYSLRFTYEDNSTRSDYRDNLFYTFFFGHLCMGEACYSCRFKAMRSSADIRVGDFWGEKYQNDKQGVSCCVAFTDRGMDAMDALETHCLIREEELSEVLREQMQKSPAFPPQRKKVLKAMRSNRSLGAIYNITLFCYRAKWKIKSVIRRKA